MTYATGRDLAPLPAAESFEAVVGEGVRGVVEGHEVFVGVGKAEGDGAGAVSYTHLVRSMAYENAATLGGKCHRMLFEHGTPSRRSPEASPKKEFKKEGRPMEHPRIPLEDLQAQVAACRRCPLCDGRTQTVFGVGNPEARVLIVGEAPGKNEDLQGEPFVGAAGKYLNELLAIAGLSREDVYIANVLKCRPPSNRDPRPEEIQACTPFLRCLLYTSRCV